MVELKFIVSCRHAELVSASIPPHSASSFAARWTLKQVQGDGSGLWRTSVPAYNPRTSRTARAIHGGSATICWRAPAPGGRSEEHTFELQSLMRIPSAVFCLKKNNAHPN